MGNIFLEDVPHNNLKKTLFIIQPQIQMQKNILILIILFQFSFYSCSSSSDSDNDQGPGVVEQNLELNKSTLNLNFGETGTITVTKAPNSSETLVWSTSDKFVATVFNGVVTAQGSGTAVITATMGTKTATCTVTIAPRTYHLVWSDEFEGTTLNTDNWTIEKGGSGWGNNEKQYYTDRPENIRVANGLLTIEARKENYENNSYTSARIKSANKKDFAYGKIEARIKLPKAAKGTWPAFWMLGYGSWPSAGEIDIMEYVGYDPNRFHCAAHTKNKNGLNGQNFKGSQVVENATADFHIISMEWVKAEVLGYDRIHMYIDGKETATFGETGPLRDSGDWPFNKNFYFILNFAIGGNWGGAQGIDDTMFADPNNPVLYQVDYVRVYQLQ